MNKKGRTIFIGDIHGCYDELKLLIEKLKIDETDTIYCVGDMIYKGPKSYKVLKFLYENRKQYHCVAGGQEMKFLNWLDGQENKKLHQDFLILKKEISTHLPNLIKSLNKANGYNDSLGDEEVKFLNWLDGQENSEHHEFFQNLKEQIHTQLPEIIDFMKKMPKYIEKEDFIVLHGGIVPNKDIDSQTLNDTVEIKQYHGKPWYEYYTGEKTIIYGHWSGDGLEIREKTIGLDSGCVGGGYLTAYILETGEIVSQKALRQYHPKK